MILTLMETSPISFERKKGRVRGRKKKLSSAHDDNGFDPKCRFVLV